MDLIDPLREYVSCMLTKMDCINLNGVLVKILNGISEVDDRSYVLLDDFVINVIANPKNSILVPPFLGNKLDSTLLTIEQFLMAKLGSKDIRDEICEVFDINDIWQR